MIFDVTHTCNIMVATIITFCCDAFDAGYSLQLGRMSIRNIHVRTVHTGSYVWSILFCGPCGPPMIKLPPSYTTPVNCRKPKSNTHPAITYCNSKKQTHTHTHDALLKPLNFEGHRSKGWDNP